MKIRQEKGIALITALLVLMLTSTMIAGLAWLVMSDQRLGGSNNDRQLAFYGAEAGMESLTASLENAFNANYALNSTAIDALMTTPGPPGNIPNVQYLAPGSSTPGSGYVIQFTPSAANANLPASSFSTIPAPSPYAGLVGLMTPYTLTVTAHTTYGSEVRLQRQVQTVGIPVFQFGIFSDSDLSFFAGPDFNFGGRVHTNGNLWLAEGDNNTLTLAQKVTAAGEIITSNLENGWPTTTNYNGQVNITTGSSVADLKVQSPAQSVTGTTNSIGNIGSYASGFTTVAQTPYNGNVAVAQTGASVLNLAIATPSIGGQPIDLIRMPVKNEDTANPAKLAERYYSQVSLRVMLADYGPSGTCTDSDLSSTAGNLPSLSPNGAGPTTPVDLATLAWDTSAGGVAPANNTFPAWLNTGANVGKTIFPLPVSGAATGTAYGAANGYWVKQYYPTITGCIKIDYQSKATPGTWVDATAEILKLGFTGRNINPQIGAHTVPTFASSTYALPINTGVPQSSIAGITQLIAASGPTANAAVNTVGCQDPSPNAVIRLARVRDNPSNAVTNNDWCGNNAGNTVGTWSGLPDRTGNGKNCPNATNGTNCPSQHGTDYWPNVLFDTREGLLRDSPYAADAVSPAGVMSYVELDVANLARWFAGTIGANGTNAANATGYSVYFSDRRGNIADPAPPASVGAAAAKTGAFGYEDIVNRASASGCPNATLEQGEDVESDYSNGVSNYLGTTPRTYGNILSAIPTKLWPIANTGTQLGADTVAAVTALVNSVLTNNPNCGGPGKQWPFAITADSQDYRENPPLFFRRALKLVNGSTISIGTCNSVPCGLTIVAENPTYIQGDYNNPGLDTGFAGVGVGASVIADAVTLLSNNWNDVNSFISPYCVTSDTTACSPERVSTDTTYRVAIVGGKGIPFLQPTFGGVGQDFGTDGGTHNFLRYLEDWGNGAPNGTLYYDGSIVNMYYSHQATGVFKCCSTVYSPPTRAYQFDTNFLTPSLLPPLTPMLRTINTIGFTQMLLPTQ